MDFSQIISMLECEKIVWNCLQRHVEIREYEVLEVTKDIIGFLGEYYKLNVIVEEDNGTESKLTFFIKTNAIKDKILNAVVLELGAFDKEQNFYARLFKDIKSYASQKWHPDCYYVGSNILVMEDLLLDGYKHLPDKVSLNQQQVRAVLSCMASMHANLISFEKKTETNVKLEYPKLQHEFSMDANEGWWHAGLNSIKSVARVHPKFQDEIYHDRLDEKIENAVNKVYEAVKPSEKFQNTFCHRDAWGKNIFFKFQDDDLSKPTQCLLVDFQTCRYLPPAVDVLIFIYLNTRRDFRNKNYDQWLRHYYDSLIHAGNQVDVDITKSISWERFMESCDFFKIVALFIMSIYIPTTYASEDVAHLKETDPEKFEHYMKEDRSDVILAKLQNDTSYREYVFEAIEECIDYVFAL